MSLRKDEDILDGIRYADAISMAMPDWLDSQLTDNAYDKSRKVDWKKLFKIGQVKIWKPEDLIDISSHTKEPSGWLLKFPKNRWEKELKSEYYRDFKHILEQKAHNQLAPAITIENEFADGRGRSLLQYALGEDVPALNLELTHEGHQQIQRDL